LSQNVGTELPTLCYVESKNSADLKI
jgi:hypothetical protein